MPKPKGKPAPVVVPAKSAPAAVPFTFDPLTFEVHAGNVTLVMLDVTTTLHRIHQDIYSASQFNPGKGNARFSPINDFKGNAIPTIYAGETFECAAMESVFHDVSCQPGLKAYNKAKLSGQVHSTVVTKQALALADLRTKALRKLGIPRNVLIDTEKSQYTFTRTVAEAIHAKCHDIQGLQWTSRQDDDASAYMLFGDRIDAKALQHAGDSKSLSGDTVTYEAVLNLAEQIGVEIVLFK